MTGSGLSLYDICLDASTSNIAISDGTNTAGVDANGALCTKVQDSNGDTLEINADGSLNVSLSGGGFTAIKATAETVGVAAGEIVATPLTDRASILIQNMGPGDVYLGEDAGVVVGDGLCIPKKSSLQYDFPEAIDLFLIASAAGTDVRILEVAS